MLSFKAIPCAGSAGHFIHQRRCNVLSPVQVPNPMSMYWGYQVHGSTLLALFLFTQPVRNEKIPSNQRHAPFVAYAR